MIWPLSLYIGLRYTRAKKRNHFISFITLFSILGITLGVLVLITVLSVMNGFDEQIKNKVFQMVPSVTVTDVANNLSGDSNLLSQIRQLPNVKAVEPYVSGQGILREGNTNSPVYLMGITPNYPKTIVALQDKLIAGSFSDLTPGSFNIVLGEAAASQLGAMIGDKVLLLTPQLNWSIAGVMPRLKRFTVVGIFHAGAGFGYDDGLALVDIQDAQTLYQMPGKWSGFQMQLTHPYQFESVETQLYPLLPASAQINSWASQYGSFFRAIAMEKTMMFFILLLIIMIAIFNLVSMQVMLVNDKSSDIAILRTLGASSGTIMRVFLVQGTIIGGMGTLLGVVLGIALALNVTPVVNTIQNIFGVQFISADIYFLDYLPSKLMWSDVMRIVSVTFGLCFLATLYPAYRASKVNPAEALRYE
jgi:lipoprotein-releasing system permease protein